MSAYLAKLPSQPNMEGFLWQINSLRLGFESLYRQDRFP